ncbi:tRNA 2-thiouridine(34) synthase MnmA [Sandaracinobacter neustonicus]|uniref:tRNA-specific 2-thiouridylase MnmA n=2 Tax=Sandaracinobacter neustonicus TaxID=1715348 RepID=A0A501XIZ0_9SPHN|nr:tRNA 2-thiouridine(34) synthase MnmA [Sandaracinobacter neustonicus]
MSGGVDSSVVAAIAHWHGCETIGVTLRLSDSEAAPARAGACCAGSDIADARAVADAQGFAHYVLDYASAFKSEVMEAFADSYLEGRTPVPCISCNQTVKFRDLLGVAQDLGAEALLTGHYVQRLDGPAGPELHRAADPSKDQSYFLFATTAPQLARLGFPLGGLDKPTVRLLAEHFGLRVANKPDSQDICFVPNGDYRAVVLKLRPGADRPGDIVDMDGHVLGRHGGLIGFTVGQRRGIEIGGQAEPLYVIRLESEANRLVVGPRAALAVQTVELDPLNWLAGPIPPEGLEVAVKLRSMAPLARALLLGGVTPRLIFPDPQFGVSPGQAAVCYEGERVLGGAFIRAAV